jgi:hypothetical protein
VYVTGGFCSTAGGSCPSSGATLAAVERATFTAATAELGAFEVFTTPTGGLKQARQRHALAVANATTAPNAFDTSGLGSDVWLLAVGGDTGGSPLTSNVVEVAKVADGTGLRALVFNPASYNGAGSTHGGWAEVVANSLFIAGATSAQNFFFNSGPVCGNSDTGDCTGTDTGTNTFNSNLNSTSVSYLSSNPRYLAGNVLFRAFVYAAGGIPKGATAPTDTVERLIY